MSFANNPYQYPYPSQAYPGYQPQPMPDQLAMLRQQQMQPQQIPPQMPQQLPAQNIGSAPDGGIIWVQGEAGARGYIVAPGYTIPLWDSEAHTIYLKTVDPSGIPSMRIFDYTERTAQRKPPGPQQEYVTRREFEAVIAQLMGANTPTAAPNTPTIAADTPTAQEV